MLRLTLINCQAPTLEDGRQSFEQQLRLWQFGGIWTISEESSEWSAAVEAGYVVISGAAEKERR